MGGKEYDDEEAVRVNDEEAEGRDRVKDEEAEGRVRFKDEDEDEEEGHVCVCVKDKDEEEGGHVCLKDEDKDEEEGHVCVCVKDEDGSSTDGWGGGACVMHCTAALPAYCSNPLVFPNESCADRLSLSTIV